ncbi:MAG: aldo/keto reductase [Synergistaceae bacterium]|nr:aldo/keto reductase [Synergistaceae bacterium]
MKTFTLNNGLKLPAIGIGTYKAELDAITRAIAAGCKYLDTAAKYGNENVIAQAISSSGLKREEFIIASKLWKSDMGKDNVNSAFNRTLENLRTDYVDVYFIHWPQTGLNVETWRVLEELYSQGKIRALGLSNFLPYHAEEIMRTCKVQPSVAQLEFHAGHTQAFALRYYQERNIVLQAWSPLARGRIFNDELILELSQKYHATPAQISLAFCLAENVMPIPRASSTLERLRENLMSENITLSPEDIMRIENMPPLGWGGEHPDRERVKIS